MHNANHPDSNRPGAQVYYSTTDRIFRRELLVGHPARWMIWVGKPTDETIEGLKKLGVGSVVFDPCGNTPASGDFLSVMRSNLANPQDTNHEK